MIIKELNDLYLRLVEDPTAAIARYGWSTREVAGEIVIDAGGKVVGIIPYAIDEGRKKNAGRKMRVPEQAARSGVTPEAYFLCDRPAYLLGVSLGPGTQKGKDTPTAKHERSATLHNQVLADCDDDGARAVLSLFASGDVADCGDVDLSAVRHDKLYVLRLEGDDGPIYERRAVRAAWERHRRAPRGKGETGQCCVTGRTTSLARLFPKTELKAQGASGSGMALVSFNKGAFESYGRTQSYNASISEEVAFNAGTALNYLASDRDRQRTVGDTVVLFWADRVAPLEECLLQQIIAGSSVDQPAEDDQTLQRVAQAFEAMRRGWPLEDVDTETRFFILGIAPNKGRMAVRFFFQDTLGHIAENYGQYLRDIEMTEVEPTGIDRLLLQTAANGDGKNLAGTLVRSCYEAMLTGKDFPSALQALVVGRMRADHARERKDLKRGQVRADLGKRAALLKACLVRRARNRQTECEVKVALDRECDDVGYLLGRLFAVMERAQLWAVGHDINTTIRDTYMGGASASPARTFQPLMRNCQMHLGKLRKTSPWKARKLEAELDEIVGERLPAEDLPGTLSQDQQAMFFIGYYHERVELRFKPREGSANEQEGAAGQAEAADGEE